MNVVADTHAWVWFLTANPRLSIKAKAALSHPENLIIIPTIVGTTLHLSEELGHPVSLVTADQAIVDSGLVPVIW